MKIKEPQITPGLDPIKWQTFHKDYPITLIIILLNIFIFGAFHLSFIGPQIQVPHMLNSMAWTSHFFHADFLHLASNMLTALIMGFILERSLGHWLYLIITLFIWNILVFLLYFFIDSMVYGFSGIGLGLLAFATLYTRKRSSVFQILWPLLIINLFIGFIFPKISILGHFFGALSGALVYLFLFFNNEPKNKLPNYI